MYIRLISAAVAAACTLSLVASPGAIAAPVHIGGGHWGGGGGHFVGRWGGGGNWHGGNWHGGHWGGGWGGYGGWGWPGFGWGLGAGLLGFGLGAAFANGGYYGGYGGGYDYRYADDHVARCEARYRSYDPGSDTFLGYDGHRHYCNL